METYASDHASMVHVLVVGRADGSGDRDEGDPMRESHRVFCELRKPNARHMRQDRPLRVPRFGEGQFRLQVCDRMPACEKSLSRSCYEQGRQVDESAPSTVISKHRIRFAHSLKPLFSIRLVGDVGVVQLAHLQVT